MQVIINPIKLIFTLLFFFNNLQVDAQSGGDAGSTGEGNSGDEESISFSAETIKKGNTYSVIDINDEGKFSIDRTNLGKKAIKYIDPKGTTNLSGPLHYLPVFLKEISELRDIFTEAINYKGDESIDNKLALADTAAQKLNTFSVRLIEPYRSSFNEGYREAVQTNAENPDVYALNYLASELSREVIKRLDNASFEVQINAKLISANSISDVHVENFDNIAAGEYSIVPRFQVLPTDAQLSAIEQYQDITTNIDFDNYSLDNLKLTCTSDDDNIATDIQSYNAKLESISNAIKNVRISTAKSEIDAAIQILTSLDRTDSCKIDEKEKVLGAIKEGFSFLTAEETIQKTVTDLSSQIRSYSIDNVPIEGYLDLKTITGRSVGDQLRITAYLIKNGNEANNKISYRLLDEQYQLIHVGAYIENDVSFVLIKPFRQIEEFNLEKEFKPNVSYTVYLKLGTKSRLWNTLQLGLGLNFALTDFDNNNAVDIGIGGSISVLKFLQYGIGYNLFADAGYQFAGINLPLNDLFRGLNSP